MLIKENRVKTGKNFSAFHYINEVIEYPIDITINAVETIYIIKANLSFPSLVAFLERINAGIEKVSENTLYVNINGIAIMFNITERILITLTLCLLTLNLSAIFIVTVIKRKAIASETRSSKSTTNSKFFRCYF